MRNITNNTPKGANLGSPVVKTNDTDRKGTFYAYQAIGGLVPVLNEADRNSIPVDTKLNEDGYTSGQRELGMVVWYMLSEKLELYRLYIPDYDSLTTPQKIAALGDNANWVEAELGTTSEWQGSWFNGKEIIPNGVVVYNLDLYQSTRSENFISTAPPDEEGNTYFRLLSKQDLSGYVTDSDLTAYDTDLRGGYTGSLQTLDNADETLAQSIESVATAVDDLEDLVNDVITLNKGIFPSYEALIDTYPIGNPGEYAIVDPVGEDAQKYIWDATEGSWVTGGQGNVLSVNGQTGVVVIGKTDVGLGNVDNTSDANKPVSAAQSTAINAAQTNAISSANAYTDTQVGLDRARLTALEGSSINYAFLQYSGNTTLSMPESFTDVLYVVAYNDNTTVWRPSFTVNTANQTITLLDTGGQSALDVDVLYVNGTPPVNPTYAPAGSTAANIASLQTSVAAKLDKATAAADGDYAPSDSNNTTGFWAGLLTSGKLRINTALNKLASTVNGLINGTVFPFKGGVTQTENTVTIPFKGIKVNITTSDIFQSATSVTYQLFKGGTGGTVRTTLVNINSDLGLLTTTEVNDGYYLLMTYSGSVGWERGAWQIIFTAV